VKLITIDFLPAEKKDQEFLYNLRRDTMKEYIEQKGGWVEEWQRKNSMLGKSFNPKGYFIITKSGEKIGCLGASITKRTMYLHHGMISPKFQGQGFFTYIMRKFISEGIKTGKDVLLQVLDINERARYLYSKLGFIVTGKMRAYFNMKYNK